MPYDQQVRLPVTFFENFVGFSTTGQRVARKSAERRLSDALRRGYDLPPAGRSLNMAAVKRTDTKPELALRRALHAAGYRFRKDYAIRADGKLIRPDVAFTKKRVAIFVDGCFWHGCPIHGAVPATNRAFWAKKLCANFERDRLQDRVLAGAGWRVVRIWEHETLDIAVAAVAKALADAESG